MSNQTAVEWLLQQMLKEGYFEGERPFTFTNLAHLQQEALAMEKSQIIKTYRDGRSDQQSERNTRWYNRNAEYYYNEKFKGDHNE
jgi:hypothetical protein